MPSNEEAFLRAILSVVARQTFPPQTLFNLVAPKSGMQKQIDAYNLCDGTRTQGEIAKQLGLDSGNFSKQVKRWVELGIMTKVVQDGAERPIHIYPVVGTSSGSASGAAA